MKALRAALKEKGQRLSALEAKFDIFSNEQKDGGNKRKKPALARKNEKECNYCKKAASGSKRCLGFILFLVMAFRFLMSLEPLASLFAVGAFFFILPRRLLALVAAVFLLV